MGTFNRFVRLLLLALTFVSLVNFTLGEIRSYGMARDLVLADGSPVAGDFINLWTAGRLVSEGRSEAVYQVDDFVSDQRDRVNYAPSIRLWAYPPHSLLFAWPFGIESFWIALGGWTLLGLLVLGVGARRAGFDWIETTIIVLSPAALNCVHYGQTGNLATGLLLLALPAKSGGMALTALAAALLTTKPQIGFLLPVLWLLRRRVGLIALTSALTIGLVAASLVLFGPQAWRDYVGDTLPILGALERFGTGQFMLMIPSVFMSLRVLGSHPDPALAVHLAVAAAVLALAVWRLWKPGSGARDAAILLLATTLATPYLHTYDLTILLCGALLVARDRITATSVPAILVAFLLVFAWGLPNVLDRLNGAGLPIAPLLILPLFLLASFGFRPAPPLGGKTDGSPSNT